MNDNDLDEEDVEKLKEFKRVAYSPPREGKLPDGWKQLSELPELPQKGAFFVEELAGGIALGRGWHSRTRFDYDLLARQRAWEIASSGNPARVLYEHRRSVTKSSLLVHCVFYKRDGRVFISFRTDDSTVLEQEVDGPYDIGREELSTRDLNNEEADELLKSLGYTL